MSVGIDALAIARATWATLVQHQDGGGSTIPQQLAKMLYTQVGETGSRSWNKSRLPSN
jgi:membrane carboxypeptidase/penicillin-binding protein